MLDEADKLVDESFYGQIRTLAAQLPKSKQVLAMSATYHEVRCILLVSTSFPLLFHFFTTSFPLSDSKFPAVYLLLY